MFPTILLATDLSPAFDAIVSNAGELRTLGCSKAVLAYVITAKSLVGPSELLTADAELRLRKLKKQLESFGFETVVETLQGLPAPSLSEAADRHSVSLIVMGSHGKRLLREAVQGSVTRSLLSLTETPVLLVNSSSMMSSGASLPCVLNSAELLRHVLFPTDFSEAGDQAFLFLRRLAKIGLVKVTLLHASQPPAHWRPAREPARRIALKRLEARLTASGVPEVQSRLVQGHPFHVIEEMTSAGDYSLVVMGTRGKRFMTRLLLGSVASEVARIAPCPVLLVPEVSEE